jgi:hypothetical protein
MAEEKPKRRWFRFSLRTVFVLVTLAAVGSWTYWIGWPWWLMHREQTQFEESVHQIKAGMTPTAASKLVSWKSRITTSTVAFDWQHNPIGLERYVWPNAIYCIFYVVPAAKHGTPSNGACSSVEVFHLPPVPAGYQARTGGGRRSVTRTLPPLKPDDIPMYGYMADFLEIISGDRKNNPGFEYELIYSDPPTKPSQ